MADHTENALRAAVRAMEEVVTPAVDPTHPLAREQAELVTGTLRLLLDQLPHARGHLAYELAHHAALAESVVDLADDELAGELDHAVAAGRRLLVDLGPTDAQLRTATARLAAATSALVRATAGSDTRDEVGQRILRGSEPLVTGQRVWLRGQGWGDEGLPTPDELFGSPDPTTEETAR